MLKKILSKDRDLIIFTLFSLSFAIIMEYLAFQQYYNDLKSLSLLTAIGGGGFLFVAIYSLIKLKELRNYHDREIERAIKYDSLTTLPNIYSFLDNIAIRKKQVDKGNGNESLFLINIGINRFKFVNETFGYSYADDILIELKNEIRKKITDKDYFCRLNGDEFGILVFLEDDNIFKYIDNLKDIFNKEYKTPNSDNSVYISGRLGISSYKKNEKNKSHCIFRKSNIALDYAKKESLFFKMYDNSLERENNKTLELEKELRIAVDNEEIEVYFQPKISTKDESIIGAEALARWFSKKQNKFIRPDIFIEMAEDMGIIDKLGDSILNKSVKELKKWQKEGFHDVKVAVNVSTYQFKKELPSDILSCLNNQELKSSDLEIEVTESGVIRDKKNGNNLLKKIQDTGITIAIDDFGTGYSSLAYLIEFPLDIIKIDKSFIDKLNDCNPEMIKKGKSVIASLIQLAHSIGCKVVAEGVEDKNQVQFLKDNNCDYIQGYYYSKPLQSEEFILYLKNKTNKKTL